MLLTEVEVFDGQDLRSSDDAILIENGFITAIGRSSQFTDYSGPRQALPGRTIIPGLIDAHSHLTLSGEPDVYSKPKYHYSLPELTLKSLQNAQASLRGGITTLRDCGGIPGVATAVRDACSNGLAVGPTILTAGMYISMTGGTNNLVSRIADGPGEIVKAVREQAAAGSDFIKLMATGAILTPGTNLNDTQYVEAELAAGIGEAHRLNLRVAVHAIGATGVVNAVRAGADSIEHGVFLDEVSIEEMVARGTTLVPTISAVKRILADRGRGLDSKVIEKAEQSLETLRTSLRAFHEAGGRIAMGCDTGTPFNYHGQGAAELGYLVEFGLSPKSALRAATSVAAELLGLPDRGTLDAGQRADLVVLKQSPLEDITAAADTTNHEMVIKDGHVVLNRP